MNKDIAAAAGPGDGEEDIIRNLAEQGLERPDLPTLGALILKPFGGLPGFVNAIYAEYDKAGPGSNNRALMIRSIVDILKISAAKVESGGEFDGVSFEEMEANVKRLKSPKREGPPDAG